MNNNYTEEENQKFNSNKIIQNFFKLNIKEIEPNTNKNINENIFEEDLIIVIDELVELYYNELNKGKEENVRKQSILNFINNYNLSLKEIYYWLLNNQNNNSNSIYLLGYFNYHGIEININKQKAFELYQTAAELENIVAQLDFANMCIYEKGNEKILTKLLSYLKSWRKETIKMQ